MKKLLVLSVILAMCFAGCEKMPDGTHVHTTGPSANLPAVTTEVAAKPAEKKVAPVKATVYDADGNIVSLVDFESDQRGNVTKIVTLDADGKEISRNEYEYDEDGNEVKFLTYVDGELTGYDKMTYNDGRKIRTNSFDAEDKERSIVQYEYDDEGNLKMESSVDVNGVVTWFFEIKRDENGFEVERIQADFDGNVYIRNVYENNDAGKPVKTTQYYGDGSLFGIFEYEYDEDGNMLKNSEYGADGKLAMTIVYEY